MDFDETPFIEPSPDEEAWEAYLGFAMERLGDDRAGGLTNAALGELEDIVGHQLPFEVGLLLVMGQPDTPPWVQWDDDPAGLWATWTAGLLAGLVESVDDGLWLAPWGPRPDEGTERHEIVAGALAASPLFPLWGHCAVPLVTAAGHSTTDNNPIVSVSGATVAVAGIDLAAWMHNCFGVPLPMWPPELERRFPLWSELIDSAP